MEYNDRGLKKKSSGVSLFGYQGNNFPCSQAIIINFVLESFF